MNNGINEATMFGSYPDIVSISQLCEMLSIGRNTAYKLIDSGEIKSRKIGRVHKIVKSSVIKFIGNNN